MFKSFYTDRKFLDKLTPEQRKIKEAEIQKAEIVAKEIGAVSVLAPAVELEMKKRLRAELTDEERDQLAEIDNIIFKAYTEEATAKSKEKAAKRKARRDQVKQWKESGEAPDVGREFEDAVEYGAYTSFIARTGIIPQPENRRIVARFAGTGYLPSTLAYLKSLQQLAFLAAVEKEYKAGKISDELLDVLRIDPGFPGGDVGDADPEEYLNIAAERRPDLLESLKQVLEPITKDDPSAKKRRPPFNRDVVMNKGIVIAPLQYAGYFGNIDGIPGYIAKQKNALAGLVKNVYQAAFKSKLNPLTPQQVEELITALESPINDEITLYVNALPAPSWYVQIKDYSVYDLRPYKQELEALLRISTKEYVQEFIDLLRRTIREFRAAEDGGIIPKRTEKIPLALDKPNQYIWDEIESVKGSSQISFSVGQTTDGDPIAILYSIEFAEDGLDGIKVTNGKKLTRFDKRAYTAASALWEAGNEVVTLTQIHHMMGNTTRPSQAQLKKINASITKMGNANIFLDNAAEIENNYKYPAFKYDGKLLPMERITVTMNGQVAAAAIHLFREPPMMTFARERNQITTVSVKLLQSPVSKTDTNLAIDDYLIERISFARRQFEKERTKPRERRKHVVKTILFETIYQKAKIKSRLEKTRAIEKIKKYLDHYQKNDFISGYILTKEGIEIKF